MAATKAWNSLRSDERFRFRVAIPVVVTVTVGSREHSSFRFAFENIVGALQSICGNALYKSTLHLHYTFTFTGKHLF